MLFEGMPVYLEWTTDLKLFQLITLTVHPTWIYRNYDINWCETKGTYFVEKNGSPVLPYVIGNKKDPNNQIASYYHWSAPHFPLIVEPKAIDMYCPAILLGEALPLFFLGKEEQKAFFENNPNLHSNKRNMFNGPWLEQFVNTWAEMGYAREGKVVECPVCRLCYDYDSIDPCPHLSWCTICQCWSIPPLQGSEDCNHRSSDGLYYCPPTS